MKIIIKNLMVFVNKKIVSIFVVLACIIIIYWRVLHDRFNLPLQLS